MTKRATSLIDWYRGQPNRATKRPDTEIAMTLHGLHPEQGWAGPHATQGNASLVRAVRRWVDRQRDGVFADLVFGTRPGGSGRYYSHLRDRGTQTMSAAIGTVSQAMATEQATRADMERRAREAMKWEAQANDWAGLNEFRKAFVCHDAANDVERYGLLQPSTRTALAIVGLAQT